MTRGAPPALMLVAAGRGARMLPLTDRQPTPLVAVARRPLMNDALALAGGRSGRGGDLVCTGLQIDTSGVVAALFGGVFSMKRVRDALIAAARLSGPVHDGRRCAAGRPEAIPMAAEMLVVAGHVRA